jgi:hypothetical protein
MRQTFDQKMPVSKQLKRIIKSAKGREYMHRKGPGRRAEDQQRKRKNVQALATGRRKKRVAAIRAYWEGESDECPR